MCIRDSFKIDPYMGGGRSPDHGSLPVAENECLWPRVSYMKAGDFLACEHAHWSCDVGPDSFPVLGAWPAQIFFGLSQVSLLALFMLAQSMEWPASLSCSDSADSISQACTDLHCGVHFMPSAQFPCRFTIVLCIKIPTFDIVSHSTFFLNRDLIVWSH